VDEQVYGDINRMQTTEIRIDWNRDVIFGSKDLDRKICWIWSSEIFRSVSIICYC